MLVGPREACDTIWEFWRRRAKPLNFYDQRLYVCTKIDDAPTIPGFRLAEMDDLETVAHYAGLMEAEDLGVNPIITNPGAHQRAVLERIRAGRTYVIAHRTEIVFQIVIGSKTAWGCQVGGTYVPKENRGRGWATRGMRVLCQHLLESYPRVTLHVNEANSPAVKVYERTGFERNAPYRLIVLNH
jgi:predicted GNAT family acetyltransferase